MTELWTIGLSYTGLVLRYYTAINKKSYGKKPLFEPLIDHVPKITYPQGKPDNKDSKGNPQGDWNWKTKSSPEFVIYRGKESKREYQENYTRNKMYQEKVQYAYCINDYAQNPGDNIWNGDF